MAYDYYQQTLAKDTIAKAKKAKLAAINRVDTKTQPVVNPKTIAVNPNPDPTSLQGLARVNMPGIANPLPPAQSIVAPVPITAPTSKTGFISGAGTIINQPKPEAMQTPTISPDTSQMLLDRINKLASEQSGQASGDARIREEAMQEALQKRLATQGISDSGIGLKQSRMVSGQVGADLSKQLGDIRQGALTSEADVISQKDQQNFLANQATNTQNFQTSLTKLQSDLARGNLTFEKQISADSEAAYNAGIAKQPLPDFLKGNPLAEAAYQSGVSGESRESFLRTEQDKIDARNLLLLSIDPTNENFVDDARIIFKQFGIEIPDVLLTQEEKEKTSSPEINPYIRSIYTR